jgi:hypothetical protein
LANPPTPKAASGLELPTLNAPATTHRAWCDQCVPETFTDGSPVNAGARAAILTLLNGAAQQPLKAKDFTLIASDLIERSLNDAE